ncbi:hypothetical protein SH2C18_30330 [Clostridium sediminicola]|uniref:helix-turn-helix transcriptional regulator n=1 Tax=Clostridium sediminicola TaxID=3114879 RepID=UPI0031F26828
MKDNKFISNNIINRQSELQLLKDSFEYIKNQNSKVIIIKGESGIGKTSLVTKGLYKEITEKAFFGYVKYLNIQNTPYYGIISILDILFAKILCENNKSFSFWKEKISKGLSSNSKYLANVSINYRKIYGINSSVKNLDFSNLSTNLQNSFMDILKIFSRNGKPLVLFIDDLQWADKETISFLDAYYDQIMDLNILFILSHRCNELEDNKAANNFINGINTLYDIEELELKNFSIEEIQKFLLQNFTFKENDLELLAKYLKEKTLGNPYFLTELIKLLYDNGLIILDENNQYLSITEDLFIHEITINNELIQLILNKLHTLSEDDKNILKYITCIKTNFTLEYLKELTHFDEFELKSSLNILINKGIIINKGSNSYGFFHDKVYTAALNMFEENILEEIDVKVGFYHLHHQEITDKNILKYIYFINKTTKDIKDLKLLKRICNFNILAAEQSKMIAYFSQALNYLNLAYSIYKDIDLQENELSFTILFEKANMHYLLGNLGESEKIIDSLFFTKLTDFQLSDLYTLKLQISLNYENYSLSIDYGKKALSKLKFYFPRNKLLLLFLLKELINLKWVLRNKTKDDLLNLNVPEDSIFEKQMNIILYVIPCTFLVNQNLFAYITIKSIIHSIKNGNSKLASIYYAGLSVIYYYIFNNYEKGLKIYNVSKSLLDNNNDCMVSSFSNYTLGVFVSHKHFHYLKSKDHCETAIIDGEKCNNIIFVSYSMIGIYEILSFSGNNLEILYNTCEDHKNFTIKNNLSMQISAISNYQLYVKLLQNYPFDTKKTKGLFAYNINEIEHIEQTFNLNMLIVIIFTIYGEYTTGLHLSNILIKKIGEQKTYIEYIRTLFYDCILILKNFNKFSGFEKVKYRSRLKKHLKIIKKAAYHNPSNYECRYILLLAEYDRVFKVSDGALLNYNKSIESAKKNKFTLIEAMANEFASSYLMENKLKSKATDYYLSSTKLFNKIGAYGKLFHMQKNEVLLMNDNFENQSYSEKMETYFNKTIFDTSGNLLKLYGLMEDTNRSSNQNIIEFFVKFLKSDLITDKIYLIHEEDDDFIIAEYFDKNIPSAVVGKSIDNIGEIPAKIIRFCCRTNEDFISFDNSKNNNLFLNFNNYLNKDKTLICLPIIKNNGLVSILYIEKTGGYKPQNIYLIKNIFRQVLSCIKFEPSCTNINNSTINTFEKLTSREIEVIRLVSKGNTYTQVATILSLSPNTIKTHMKKIYSKFYVSKKADALKIAEKEGYLNNN